ncbi:hypothetical protein A1O1_06793 [Capronia coronata CBS 617.96]|uniref:Extracellular membrane protein CFEM domain-containing protein n=1 Tax=Capronia coronata CBS 617.96 TaxID=1182541 RepID=W9YLM6_9EURO|nr:uncharacterized protein A1O1_06793 [Capronia coronata CBS 617.96]EXJ83174.1 hypothetical protein A1O1_06793 [Capronia coronata CBS 617.96]
MDSPSPASTLDRRAFLRLRAEETNTCLPQSILSIVPECAVSCIQAFATTNYSGSTCPNTSDLNFLCTQENTSGLTIGEGSLQCVVSFCTGQEQVDTRVYSICDGIAGAQPKTASTITVTIIAPSTAASTMGSLPSMIGVPTSTEDISTIVMATDTPTSAIPPSPATTPSPSSALTTELGSSSSSTISGPQGTTGAVGLPDRSTSKGGLSTAQVVGIAIAGAATVLIVLGMLMLAVCIRKRRRAQRRSQRRSRLVEPTPPPNYKSPPKPISPTFGNVNSSLAVPTSQGRFYSAAQPMEEKRRSFWRRSIRPEEIGVAVSPKVPGESSPVSISSQQSGSRLLSSVPAKALWPAPLNVQGSRERQRLSQRPMSDATVFDDEPQTRFANSEPVYVDNQPFILEQPPLGRRDRVAPPHLRLPAVPEVAARRVSKAARIPLTPTYDNGNVNIMSPPRGFGSPPSDLKRGEVRPTASQSSAPVAEHKLAPSSSYASRNVLRKKPPSRLLLRALDDQPVEHVTRPLDTRSPPSTTAAPRLEREDSITSVYTEIEEDTPPDETDRQLELGAAPQTPSTGTKASQLLFQAQGSPIKDLRYPQIPRSAAMSRQAKTFAKPLASPAATPAGPAIRPTRDQLVRAGASFMQTDTTSSDGYLSDETLDWPRPPLSEAGSRRGTSIPQDILNTEVAKLRNYAVAGNRGPPSPLFRPSLNEVLRPKSVKIPEPQRSPSSKARLTPNKSSRGDLYLTVEI